eukprot:14426083-Alexandrium_andersonii.AAC.1
MRPPALGATAILSAAGVPALVQAESSSMAMRPEVEPALAAALASASWASASAARLRELPPVAGAAL